MPCQICGASDFSGFCPPCMDTICNRARNTTKRVKLLATELVQVGEKNWLEGRVQYSDEVQGMGQTKMHGQAFGFTAQAKNFTLNAYTTPTQAVQKFISPGSGFNTICDCRAFMIAVYYNAICKALSEIHPSLFDIVFDKLEVNAFKDTQESDVKVLFSLKEVTDDAFVEPGDWLYVISPSADQTEVNEGMMAGKQGAAGGWNLLCVEATGTKRYIGLGLSDKKSGKITAQTLNEILSFLKEAGKAKSNVQFEKSQATRPPLARRGSGDFELTQRKAKLQSDPEFQQQLRSLALAKKKFRLYQFSGRNLELHMFERLTAYNREQGQKF